MAFSILCHGSRGSVPVSGESFHRYGGGTTCYEIRVSDDHRLMIDAGTGALRMLPDLPADRPLHFAILFTHVHWDHTFAIPFFSPLYDHRNWFDFYGYFHGGMDMEEAIDRVMRPPWFPVNFRSTRAQKRFHLLEGETFEVEGFQVSTARLHHPDGVTAYRLERDGLSMVMATDVEHGDPESERALRELADGADVLFYDAQYVPAEYERLRVGWGHSTWQEAVKVASDCGAGRLVLTSHDPARTDDGIDEILRLARESFPNTEAAYEGMLVDVG